MPDTDKTPWWLIAAREAGFDDDIARRAWKATKPDDVPKFWYYVEWLQTQRIFGGGPDALGLIDIVIPGEEGYPDDQTD